MLKPCFSTVACPDLTLEQAAALAEASGFGGIELRTLGAGSQRLACDPALTAPEKARSIFESRGVEIAGIGSSARFDAPVWPPVIGLAISDNEKSVREAKEAVDLARALGAPFVRVFAFEPAGIEKPAKAEARIVERLRLVADAARNTGVRIALENGGGWERAADAARLVEKVDHPLVGIAYSAAAGWLAEESVEEAIDATGGRLFMARIKDIKNEAPCLPGDGEVPCERLVRALMERGWDGPLVFEWDRLWLPELAPAERVMGAAAERIYGWMGDRGAERRAGMPRAATAHA